MKLNILSIFVVLLIRWWYGYFDQSPLSSPKPSLYSWAERNHVRQMIPGLESICHVDKKGKRIVYLIRSLELRHNDSSQSNNRSRCSPRLSQTHSRTFHFKKRSSFKPQSVLAVTLHCGWRNRLGLKKWENVTAHLGFSIKQFGCLVRVEQFRHGIYISASGGDMQW